MDRQVVIDQLNAHAAELRAAGVISLSLFGSTARGEAQPGSDIDLLADFDRSRIRTLLDVMKLQSRIADLVGAPVDLAERSSVRPKMRPMIEGDLVSVF